MKYELLIQNGQGKVFEISELTDSVEYSTNRTGSPGKLSFSLHKAGDLSFNEGNSVRFSVDGQLVFFGYIFSKSKNRWDIIEVTCYDQLRYLKANESYAFVGKTVGQIIAQIASQFNLKTGTLEDTGYAIPSLIRENKSCLDTINYALELTTLNTGKIFVFYDDGGKLSLRLAENLMTTTVIGDKSLLTEYDYKTDIDSDTFNQVKLVRPNKQTGKADTYIFKDSDTISQWGLLQKYDSVDEEMNEAQIVQKAKTMLKYYNRVLRTLTIQCLGVLGIRAGSMVMINIPDLGDISLSKFVLLDRVSHTFENDVHTMEIETRTIQA